MIEIRLYGNLQRFAESKDPDAESIAWLPWQSSETVEMLLRRIGIDPEREVSNIFINGHYRYTAREIKVKDGDRLGVFPKNMGL